jgi:Galactose oxidase, central domain
VANGSGTAAANVTNIVINCGTTGLTVGGSVSGLMGGGLVLQDNGGDNFAVNGTGNVPFTFVTPLSAGSTYNVTVFKQPSNPAQVCSVVNGSGTANSNVGNVQVICTQPGFKISGSVVGLVVGPGDTMELQDNAGDDLFVAGDTTFTFPTQVTNGGIYNVSVFLPPTSQPQLCNEFFYTGIAITNVSDVLVDCQHNDWGWVSWYLPKTSSANNYASVTTPLQPPNEPFPVNTSTPGGRDFATTWTDHLGRKWLFGGFGFPYPSPLGNQLPGYLNDLWVYDGSVGGWVPANLAIFTNSQNLPPVFQDRVETLEEEDVPTGAAPGSRWGSSSWTDKTTGDLYLFGGQGVGSDKFGLLNDLWKCTPGASVDPQGAGTSSCPWTLVGGSTTANSDSVYGTQSSPGGTPGGRWAAATTTDGSGNFWLFGGQGLDSAAAPGTAVLLNDLWEYNPGSNQWTWMGPSNSNVGNQNGNYGTQGTGSGTTAPGGRQAAVLWADSAGNIWLFGGFGLDSVGTGNAGPPPAGAILNDLWEFNITTKQWVWISGANLANQTGVYGTQAISNVSTPSAGAVPGSRWGAVGWTDSNNNLWFFGGWGYGTTTTDPTGFMSDIWEYQQSSKQWLWWKGNSNANQNTQIPVVATTGIPFVNSIVGARRGTALWQQDPLGYVWVFGGEGYDTSQGAPPGYLNDLWTYLPFPN